MKIKKEVLFELDLPSSAKEDRVVDTDRWSIQHEIIFDMSGKFYRAYYQVGATEYQDESPWEFANEVEVTEVEQVPETVLVWREKK